MSKVSSGRREAALEIDPAEFRRLGHRLVDRIAAFLEELPELPVTRDEAPASVAQRVEGSLPETGDDPGALLDEAADLLLGHSLFNGHPRFGGYITSSAAPIGALADLLASTVNPNVGGWRLSPMATEIERTTVRWIAELLGYPPSAGGLLVSGGNQANFVCFWAARAARATWDVRKEGATAAPATPFAVYASAETHTWIQKAADLSGLGTDAVRWIAVDSGQRLRVDELERALDRDSAAGVRPLLVVGTAGSVATGAIDPLLEIAALCRNRGIWFHVDGAYGGFAAALPDADPALAAIAGADSVAVDPHKWLYAPLEAGCALVRDPAHLLGAFSYRPSYYQLEEEATNYFEYGPQNSRGFRALKVWLALRQAGRQGYRQMIGDDIALARALHERVAAAPELEPLTCSLSITTFRFVPEDLRPSANEPATAEYLNRLNEALTDRIERCGEWFVSNAVVDGRYALRCCIVNFRTQLADIEALPEIVVRHGRELDRGLRDA